MQAVECRYRGRVIGWLTEDVDGQLRYVRDTPMAKYLARRRYPSAWNIPYD